MSHPIVKDTFGRNYKELIQERLACRSSWLIEICRVIAKVNLVKKWVWGRRDIWPEGLRRGGGSGSSRDGHWQLHQHETRPTFPCLLSLTCSCRIFWDVKETKTAKCGRRDCGGRGGTVQWLIVMLLLCIWINWVSAWQPPSCPHSTSQSAPSRRCQLLFFCASAGNC